MKPRLLLTAGVFLALVAVSIAMSVPALADSPNANQATVEMTIHDNGGVSIGGIDLQSLGVMPLAPQAALVAQDLQNVHLQAANDAINIAVQDTPVATLNWNPASRAAATKLAQAYGVQITPEQSDQLEKWLSTSNIDFTARFSNDMSKPANIAISQLLLVDIAPSGQLMVEKIPLAAAITPEALQTIQLGGNQATACLNKGTLTAKVDGNALPSLTLKPDGVNLIVKSLNLPVSTDVTTEVLSTTVGLDLSLPGGTHSTETCGGS